MLSKNDPARPVTSELEKEKYAHVYKTLDRYRMGMPRYQKAQADVARMTPGSKYLDVGCGRGEVINLAMAAGHDAYGLELVPDLCDGTRVLEGEIYALPWPEKAFDYVSCYDVLEHLEPGTEGAALDELGRVCRGVLILTTNDKRSRDPTTGRELHLIRKPREAWEMDISQRWPTAAIERSSYNKNEWHWRINVRATGT